MTDMTANEATRADSLSRFIFMVGTIYVTRSAAAPGSPAAAQLLRSTSAL